MGGSYTLILKKYRVYVIENGHPDALRVGDFAVKIWERFRGRGHISHAQLSPIGVALESILQRRKKRQTPDLILDLGPIVSQRNVAVTCGKRR